MSPLNTTRAGASAKGFGMLNGAPAIISVEYLVLAGGGGGGSATTGTTTNSGGGGGGGAALTASGFICTLGVNYTVTIGAGGAADTDGNNSVFSTITANKGGKGGNYTTAGSSQGTGGGGGVGYSASTATNGGTGSQGGNGANGVFNSGNTSTSKSGGGGGAGGNASSWDGGNGLSNSLSGSSQIYGCGGYGWDSAQSSGNRQAGALTGNNSGAGGIGGYRDATFPTALLAGSAGKSGVVILKYLDTKTITIGAGLTASTSTAGGYKTTTITAGTGNVSWA